MSIKSDVWVTQQCKKPTHEVYDVNGFPTGKVIHEPHSDTDRLLVGNWCGVNKREPYMGLPFAAPISEEYFFEPMIHGFQEHYTTYVHKTTGEPYKGVPPKNKRDDYRQVIPYGLYSCVYEARLTKDASRLLIVKGLENSEFNPKVIIKGDTDLPTVKTDTDGGVYIIVPPRSYLMGPTLENIIVPEDVLVMVQGNTSYSGVPLTLSPTLLEPEFEGNIQLKLFNNSDSDIRVYLGEGICTLVFQSLSN